MRSGRLACWDAERWDHEGAVQHKIILYFPYFEARSNLQQANMQQHTYMMVLRGFYGWWLVRDGKQTNLFYITCVRRAQSSRMQCFWKPSSAYEGHPGRDALATTVVDRLQHHAASEAT